MTRVACASACVGTRLFEYFRVVVFTTVGRGDVDSPSSSSVELIVALFVTFVVVFVGSVVVIRVVFAFVLRLVLIALAVRLVVLSVDFVPAPRCVKFSERSWGGVHVYVCGLSLLLPFVFVCRVGAAVIVRSFVVSWNRCSLFFLRFFALVSVGTVHVCARGMSLTFPFVMLSRVCTVVLMFAPL